MDANIENLQIYHYKVGYLNTESYLYDMERQLHNSTGRPKDIFIQFHFDAYYNYEFDDKELFLNDYKQYVLFSLNAKKEKISKSEQKIYDNNIFVSINRYWVGDKMCGPSRLLIDQFILKWKKKYPEKEIAYIVIPMKTASTIISYDGRVQVKFRPPFEYPDLISQIWK